MVCQGALGTIHSISFISSGAPRRTPRTLQHHTSLSHNLVTSFTCDRYELDIGGHVGEERGSEGIDLAGGGIVRDRLLCGRNQ